MPTRHKDTLFAKKQKTGDFVFDEKVTGVFDEMLERSVPFYGEIQRMIAELARTFAQPRTAVYDLGCSTGTTMVNVIKALRGKNVKVIGVDNSPHMLAVARRRLENQRLSSRAALYEADLNQPLALGRPSVVILVLTLQFIRPTQRELLIQSIFQSLSKGGAVIIVDKVLGNDSLTTRLFIEKYYAFKARQGYSRLEIARKREALENVLIPYRLEENLMMLRRSGFPVTDTFFTWYNFAGFLGVKQ
jgi:tRNA (cmo5U34)-methyltransferase